MPIYRIADNQIIEIEKTSFEKQKIKERADLQNMLKKNIGVLCPDSLVVAEEFGNWEESKRSIDLLGIDKEANLLVIELKRTKDGGHMELQAIRYAAMISTLTFDDLVSAYSGYLQDNNDEKDPREDLLNFLEWEEPDEERFGQEMKIILASAGFSKELTTSVIWLNDFGLDIRCVRIQPYVDNGDILLDVQSIIPIPETAEYQVRIREKKQKERGSRSGSDWSRYDVRIGDEQYEKQYKKWMMFHIISGVLHQYNTSETVEKLKRATPQREKLFLDWDGDFDLEEVRNKIPPNRHIRYFIKDENEIFHIGGKTYALTTQGWVAGSYEPSVRAIQEMFPELNIEFERVAD